MSCRIVRKFNSDELPVGIIKGGRRNGQYVVVSQERGRKEVDLDDSDSECEIEPMMSKDLQTLYVSGPRRCGKSTIIGKILTNTQAPVYCFSASTGDKTIENVIGKRFKRVDCETLVDDPITSDQFENHVALFDDIDSFDDKEVNKAVIDLHDNLLKCGRHRCKLLGVIRTNHAFFEAGKTKQSILHCDAVIAFPHSGGKGALIQFLLRHMHLNKKQIDKILDINSRWILLYRNSPTFVLSGKKIMLLD